MKKTLLILPLILFIGCKKAPEKTGTQKDVSPPFKWSNPEQDIKGVSNLINKTLPDAGIQWKKGYLKDHEGFSILTLWKIDSPLKMQTLGLLGQLHKEHRNIDIRMVSQKEPPLQLITNSNYNRFQFGTDQTASLEKELKVSSYPQVIVLAPDSKVCWQGNPQHLTKKTLRALQTKWESR